MTASKTAIVTGGGTGIGRAAARHLVRDGWRVVIAGRRREPLEATAGELGSDVIVHQADVTDESSVAGLLDAVADACGRLDLLFNNAGANVAPGPVDELTLDQWRTVIDTNLTGAFLCARAAFRQMRRQQPQGGRIINNGSISAAVPRPGSAPYTASKHAITGLTRSLSLDGRPHQIACGQIDIGNALTEMAAKMQAGVAQADGSIVVEPTMDVDHVGRAVAYMASLPLDANVQFMTVMATNMPFIGRG